MSDAEWVLVPREPTIDMEIAATEEWLVLSAMEDRSAAIWKAMLASAPVAPGVGEAGLRKKIADEVRNRDLGEVRGISLGDEATLTGVVNEFRKFTAHEIADFIDGATANVVTNIDRDLPGVLYDMDWPDDKKAAALSGPPAPTLSPPDSVREWWDEQEKNDICGLKKNELDRIGDRMAAELALSKANTYMPLTPHGL